MSQIDARSQACSSAARPEQILRLRLLAQGQVQGVGFRPFIYRLAAELHLTGSVGNTSEGVLVEVQGRAGDVRRFPVLLREQLPPLARLTGLESEETAIVRGESEFRIVMSHGHHGHNVLISPDVGLCPDCAADMRDPENRRHGYAFTNCTNCGPRYTITRSIPYDRAVTSMACFPMCPECAKEYGDPLDRRFHAQPVACPACGPRLWFVSHEEALAGRSELTEQTMENALERACVCLLEGRILALRGLGGFQLACDARSAGTLGTLRQRKNRPHKSFALMVRDLETARTLCLIDEAEAELLASPARPAVILQAKERVLPPEVAPDIATLAVMLPTTPLHVVLFDHLAGECLRLGRPAPVLVMTSGNDSGDPICLGNREALARLRHIADDFLLHNRDILCRVDDSVVACSRNPISGEAEPFFFRRARGYVPSPTPLGREADACSFGAGADLKATCCLTRGGDAFVGQHTGDLEHPAAASFYDEVTEHLSKLLEVKPDIVVADCHPNFYTSAAAADLAARSGAKLATLQHHAAHAAAVLAEHQIYGPALALVLDGYGYGLDGTVWGGELLRMDLEHADWGRAGHLTPFALPGGDAATRAPWRLALSLALGITDRNLSARVTAGWEQAKGREAAFIRQMLERGVNSPLCSSCGRLFDAVSAQLHVCLETSYEGQAAIRLETLALQGEARAPSIEQAPAPVTVRDGMALLDSHALFARVCRMQEEGLDPALIALDFHHQLAWSLVRLVLAVREPSDRPVAGLAGGVVNNTLLRRMLVEAFAEQGISVLVPSAVPAGDGGISLGQAAWGLALLRNSQDGVQSRQ